MINFKTVSTALVLVLSVSSNVYAENNSKIKPADNGDSYIIELSEEEYKALESKYKTAEKVVDSIIHTNFGVLAATAGIVADDVVVSQLERNMARRAVIVKDTVAKVGPEAGKRFAELGKLMDGATKNAIRVVKVGSRVFIVGGVAVTGWEIGQLINIVDEKFLGSAINRNVGNVIGPVIDYGRDIGSPLTEGNALGAAQNAARPFLLTQTRVLKALKEKTAQQSSQAAN